MHLAGIGVWPLQMSRLALHWDRGRLARLKLRLHPSLGESVTSNRVVSTRAGETPAVPVNALTIAFKVLGHPT
jgi:hypothetical protein